MTKSLTPVVERFALEDLLAPLDVGTFVRDYFEQRPVHIKGHPDKVAGLFASGDLQAAIRRQQEVGLSIRASFDRRDGPPGVSRHVQIDAREAQDYWDRGASLCLDPADAANETLARLAAAARRSLRFTGSTSVKCYVSPHDYGFNAHFDAHVTTAIQLEGSKRWRYSTTPAVAFPVDNAFVDDGGSVRYNHRTPSSLRPWELVEGPAELDVEEVVLEPGDVLCLPGGTWHAAKAIGYSLALNLAFTPLPFGQILQAVLAHAVQDRVEWRRGLPVAPGADGMPGEVRDYAAARLREAGAILEGLAGDPSLLEPAWRDLVEAPLHGEPAPVAAPAGQAGAAPRSAAATGGFDGRMTCSIPVGGLQAAIAWYREVLGAEPVSTVPGFGWAQLTSPVVGVSLGLSEMPTGGVVPNFGVHDLDAMRARLEAQGVAFEGDTQVIPGLVKLATFLDPFGNRLMMYQDLGTTQE